MKNYECSICKKEFTERVVTKKKIHISEYTDDNVKVSIITSTINPIESPVCGDCQKKIAVKTVRIVTRKYPQWGE